MAPRVETDHMGQLRTMLGDLPQPVRFLLVGAIVGGVVGGVTGLAVGLVAYAPTAWFAVFEAGVPASVVGGLLGLVCWPVVHILQSLKRHEEPRS